MPEGQGSNIYHRLLPESKSQKGLVRLKTPEDETPRLDFLKFVRLYDILYGCRGKLTWLHTTDPFKPLIWADLVNFSIA